MSRTILKRLAPALLLTISLAACAADPEPELVDDAPAEQTDDDAGDVDDAPAEQTDADGAFPVTITHDGGELTLDAPPTAIVTLSPTATEMVFAIGAGDLVVASDSFSNFPPEAPLVEDLSGFDPNVEAILGFEPDLVIAQSDSNDLVASLDAVGVPVILQGSAVTLDDTYRQLENLGMVTGHLDEATGVVESMGERLSELADGAAGEGLTYYHELSADLFSTTSATFIGQVYGLFGLENIADPADADGAAFGYPQLSAEFVVDADPDLVFLACTKFCSETAETFGARDGFGGMTAVQNGNVIELDDDIASRWGPRVVDFAESIAKALANANT